MPLRSRALWFVFLPFLFSCLDTNPAPERRRGEKTTSSSEIRKKLAAPDETLEVGALSVSAKEIPLVIETTGRTVPSDRFQARVEQAATITSAPVNIGDSVEPGQALIKFDDEETKLRLELVKAELKEAEAATDEYEYVVANREKLEAEEKLKPEEGEWIEKKLPHAQATAERARAEVPLLERLSQNTSINSPISGVVTQKNVSDGAQATPNATLVEVIRIDPLKISFFIPQEDASAVEKDADISIRFPNNQAFTPESYQIGTEADEKTRQLEVLAAIQNDNLSLKAGLECKVSIKTKAKKTLISIPASAIYSSDKTDFVFKITPTNRLKKTPVILGERQGDQILVRSGLIPGDVIVTSSEKEPVDNAQVEVISKR